MTEPRNLEDKNIFIPPRDLAALDLGSNSFHLLIVRYDNGQIKVLDQLNEYVRLAAGLDKDNLISDSKTEEAINALARISQRLRGISTENVRIVGTNTLRKAKNSSTFLQRAEETVGHPIEVISGAEEARLIYEGVISVRGSGTGRHLIIDIGGGSTELIIGQSGKPLRMESLFMGCVSLSRQFFPDGVVTQKNMSEAIKYATLQLLPISESYRSLGWKTAIGSSGTVKAILKTVQTAGWCKNLITSRSLTNLTNRLITKGNCTANTIEGLSKRRAPVFAGGVAALNACFNILEIEKMEVSDVALREGVIQDLIGRGSERDIRSGSVIALANRYHIDMAQADRIRITALSLFQQTYKHWLLDKVHHRLLLSWAAILHEIGLDISHHQYHKHGGYILAHSDLTGFSMTDQAILSTLVRGHRRKLSSAVFSSIPHNILLQTERLVVLLRLAVLLHRHRQSEPLPPFKITSRGKQIKLELPSSWLQHHPLTHAQIDEENELIRPRGYAILIQSTL